MQGLVRLGWGGMNVNVSRRLIWSSEGGHCKGGSVSMSRSSPPTPMEFAAVKSSKVVLGWKMGSVFTWGKNLERNRKKYILFLRKNNS